MGPSGSGKTSLLDILASRSSFQSGSLYLNGNSLMSDNNAALKKWLKRKVAYVRQKDVFFEHLTVRDQLMFTAFLRLSSSSEEKKKEVEHILKLLKLEKCADTTIKLISGGERKRTNIGTELLTDPSIILLDEPTSGLDSTGAVALMKLLKSVIENKTIICSIHQPSSGIFASFDKVLFLCEGSVVYFGTPYDSLVYLQCIKAPCPEGYNAADWWMDLLTTEDDDLFTTSQQTNTNIDGETSGFVKDLSGKDEGEEIVKSFLKTKGRLIQLWTRDKVSNQIEESINAGNRNSIHCELVTDDQKYNTSWWTQFKILTHRSMKKSRNEIFTFLNMVKSFFMGLLVGMMWFKIEYTEARVQDLSAYYFFTMAYWVFDSMYGALLAFPLEREVLFKERASGQYRLSAYFFAKTFAEAPTRLALPLIYMFVSYWLAGIRNNFSIFISSIGCTLLVVVAGESIGLWIGAMVMDMEKAVVVMVLYSLALLIPGGFFLENIPSFLLWVKYISPFKYSFDSSLTIVFDRSVPCDGSGVIPECSLANMIFASPEEVLHHLGVQGSIGFNILMLIVISIAARFGAYIFLRTKKAEERL